jgi:hypothetical protein
MSKEKIEYTTDPMIAVPRSLYREIEGLLEFVKSCSVDIAPDGSAVYLAAVDCAHAEDCADRLRDCRRASDPSDPSDRYPRLPPDHPGMPGPLAPPPDPSDQSDEFQELLDKAEKSLNKLRMHWANALVAFHNNPKKNQPQQKENNNAT